MNTTSSLTVSNGLVLPLLLVVFCGAVTYAGATGGFLPLVSSPRAALIVLLVAGMGACTLGGISQVAASGHWASPVAILGYLLGAAILAYAGAGLFDYRLPLAAVPAQAVLCVGALIAVKMVVGAASYLLKLA